ncbi:hypothetical protein ACLB2K_061761 [Fragaria x ananassa]
MLVRGYELSKSGMGCCKKNALHLETMEEISKLRKQLLKLVFNPFGVYGGVKEFSWIYGSQKERPRTVLKPQAAGRERVHGFLAKLEEKEMSAMLG